METNPFEIFRIWLASEGYSVDGGHIKPDLPFVLSTCVDNMPSSRVLFLKKFIGEELFFFTNKESKKGEEISLNPNVSMCIFFEKSNKQIRIEGKVLQSKDDIADEYFASRPLFSKASAIVSKQSKELKDYEKFMEEVQSLANRASANQLKRPKEWAGYKIVPNYFEFWEGRDFRCHIRTAYKKDLKSKILWDKSYLYP